MTEHKRNISVHLASRPQGVVVESNFDFQEEDIHFDQIHDGELIVKVLYLSVDPYLRGRMNEVAPSYTSSFALNKPISSSGVGEVVLSKNEEFKEKDLVYGSFEWKEYATLSKDQAKTFHKLPHGTQPEIALSALGGTGLSAYFGLLDVGQPKEGETVVVSGAAGAVGMVVGQIAKIKGCKVLGIAGSDEKINYLKEELGFDYVLNYKTTANLQATIKELIGGVDVYFDNTGGTISDAVLANINRYARIVVCGQISLYNQPPETWIGPRVAPLLLTKFAKMQGFLVVDYLPRRQEATADLIKWVQEGKLKDKQTIIHGIKSAPKAFIGMMAGDNLGKMLVKL